MDVYKRKGTRKGGITPTAGRGENGGSGFEPQMKVKERLQKEGGAVNK